MQKFVYDLMRTVAEGEPIGMPRSRPMPSIEKGVHELRLRDILVYAQKSVEERPNSKLKGLEPPNAGFATGF